MKLRPELAAALLVVVALGIGLGALWLAKRPGPRLEPTPAAPPATRPRATPLPAAAASEPTSAPPLPAETPPAPLQAPPIKAERLWSAVASGTPASELPALVERLEPAEFPRLTRRLLELKPQAGSQPQQLERTVRALGTSARPEASAALSAVLAESQDAQLHLRFLRWLPSGAGAARTLLGALEGQKKPELRVFLLSAAAQKIEAVDDPEVERAFEAATRDSREAVRAEAARALGRPQVPRVSPVLEDLIVRDPSDAVRGRALLSLATASRSPEDKQRSLGAIDRVARDQREPLGVRLAAIEALAQLQTPEAADHLEAIARTDPDAQAIGRATALAERLRAALSKRK